MCGDAVRTARRRAVWANVTAWRGAKLGERLDRIENGMAADEAMRAVADEINKRIRQNLERRPDLRRKYKRVTGREWTLDWWCGEP